MPTEYAHALSQVLRNTRTRVAMEQSVDSLVSVLTAAGKMRALPAILREYERILERRTTHAPTLAIAHEQARVQAQKEVRMSVGAHAADARIVIDPLLIGGWRYTDADTRADASYHHALVALYRTITQRKVSHSRR